MKKNLVALMALALFAVASPVLAGDMQMDGMKMEHGAAHHEMDEQCAKECAMLLKNCALEADSIQTEIKKLHVQIEKKGADAYTLEELKALNTKLKDANETLRVLQKPGK